MWRTIMSESRFWPRLNQRVDDLRWKVSEGAPVPIKDLHNSAIRVLSGEFDGVTTGQVAPPYAYSTQPPSHPYYPPTSYPPYGAPYIPPQPTYAPPSIPYNPYAPPTSSAMIPAAPVQPPVQAPPSGPSIKEEMKQVVEAMLAPIISDIRQELAALRIAGPSINTSSSTPRNDNGQCHYCGETGHQIMECPHLTEDTTAGLVKRNINGRVILASGASAPYIPSRPNATLHKKVLDYHERNPGQRAAGQMSSNTNIMLYEIADSEPRVHQVFQLSTTEHAQSLQNEMALLNRTRAQVYKAPNSQPQPSAPSVPAAALAPAPSESFFFY